MMLRGARIIILIGYFALLALIVIWHAWWYPSLYFPTALVLIVTAIPLLMPLRGILYGRPRAYFWAAVLMMLCFMHGVVEAYANPVQRLPALLELSLSLVVFSAAIFHLHRTRTTTADYPQA